MMLKVAVAVIFVTVLVQTQAAGDELAQLKQLVDKAIVEGKAKVDVFAQNYAQESKLQVTRAKSDLDKDYKGFYDELQKFKERAKEAKIDITDCMKGTEEGFKSLAAAYPRGIAKCDEKTYTELGKLVAKAKSSVQVYTEDVQSLKDAQSECGKDAACQAKVKEAIVESIVTVPVDVIRTASDTITLVEEANNVMGTCLSVVGRELVQGADNILDQVNLCIKYKIGPAPVPT